MSHRINFLDPPDHTRVRALVSKAFTPRRIADLVPWIKATAERLLDDLEAERELGLLQRFAHQLPSLVISELLGIPSAASRSSR
jgi:cytochrome P450